MMINVVMSALIWGTALVVLMSILFTGGAPIPVSWKKKGAFLDKSDNCRTGVLPSKKECFEVFGSAIVIRIVMLLFAAVAICLFMEQQSLTLKAFLDRFVVWDAQWYTSIAEGGYKKYMQDGQPITLVFFPLYSYMMRYLGIVLGDIRVAGLVISILCYAFGCCFMYAFTCRNYGKEVAKKAVLYLSISPFGFFFGTIMTEGLFFMLICMCLYFMNENKWALFAIVGIFCALTRMQGILIIIPACIHWFEEYKPIESIRKKDWKTFWQNLVKRLLWIPVPIIGILIYLYVNYRVTGDAFKFLEYQKGNWTHQYQYIGKALILDFQNAFTGDLTMLRVGLWIPQALFFLLGLGLCIYAVKRFENKLIAYLLANMVVSYSLDWLLSGSRYLLTAVPLWIILAELGTRSKRLDRAITILTPILMGIYYVGYIFWKQIM